MKRGRNYWVGEADDIAGEPLCEMDHDEKVFLFKEAALRKLLIMAYCEGGFDGLKPHVTPNAERRSLEFISDLEAGR